MDGLCSIELTIDFNAHELSLINQIFSKYLLLFACISLPKSTRTPRTLVNFTMIIFLLSIENMDIFVVMGTAIVEK